MPLKIRRWSSTSHTMDDIEESMPYDSQYLWKQRPLGITETSKVSIEIRDRYGQYLARIADCLKVIRNRAFDYATPETIAAATAPFVPLPLQSHSERRFFRNDPILRQREAENARIELLMIESINNARRHKDVTLKGTWFEDIAHATQQTALEQIEIPDSCSMSYSEEMDEPLLSSEEVESDESDEQSTDASVDEQDINLGRHTLDIPMKELYATQMIRTLNEIDENGWDRGDPRSQLSVAQLIRLEKEFYEVVRGVATIESSMQAIDVEERLRKSNFKRAPSGNDGRISRLKNKGLGSPLREITHAESESTENWEFPSYGTIRKLKVYRADILPPDRTDCSGIMRGIWKGKPQPDGFW